MLINNISNLKDLLSPYLDTESITKFMDVVIESTCKIRVQQPGNRDSDSPRRTRTYSYSYVQTLPVYANGPFQYFYTNIKNPITSYGFIVLKIIDGKFHVAILRRRHSISFVTFINGNWRLDDSRYIANLMQFMTEEERNALREGDYEKMFKSIWVEPLTRRSLIKKYENALDKFNRIREGFTNDEGVYLKLNALLEDNPSRCAEADWGLPKGKREKNEESLDCAKRELEEETGLRSGEYRLLDKIYPLYEKYVSNDRRYYKHIYYVAVVEGDADVRFNADNPYQVAEVGEVGMFPVSEALGKMRKNKKQKQKMFRKLREILMQKYPELMENVEYDVQ